ncbi:hypothetical protein BscR1v2_002180 [Bartonella schoenbuchensis R1]|uniref:Uncharacterized protein n=2 Tax=Bartonella schoenbuchensis TaxID=165694 RepID=A0A1S6XP79_BARSR|nr:hypothetical protein BscR1v2_002180 [Bartonella schoenbuchensis R1]CDP79709.1 hypothetical protein BN1046_00606 [Bartonella schoenbuchensis]
MPQEYQGTSENTVRLCVGNLTKKDVMIRSIRISKNSPFKFVKNACHFVDWKIQGSNEHLIFNKTSSKHISLCPEKIKSNADKEYALNFFIVPAARSTCFDLIITCRSVVASLHAVSLVLEISPILHLNTLQLLIQKKHLLFISGRHGHAQKIRILILFSRRNFFTEDIPFWL